MVSVQMRIHDISEVQLQIVHYLKIAIDLRMIHSGTNGRNDMVRYLSPPCLLGIEWCEWSPVMYSIRLDQTDYLFKYGIDKNGFVRPSIGHQIGVC